MKYVIIALIFAFLGIGLVGCSEENSPPEKTTLEKLYSEDVSEQLNGLQEVDNKYQEDQ